MAVWVLVLCQKIGRQRVYKGKNDRRDCANYRGISILSIPGKKYGMLLISRVIESRKKQVAEE